MLFRYYNFETGNSGTFEHDYPDRVAEHVARESDNGVRDYASIGVLTSEGWKRYRVRYARTATCRVETETPCPDPIGKLA